MFIDIFESYILSGDYQFLLLSNRSTPLGCHWGFHEAVYELHLHGACFREFTMFPLGDGSIFAGQGGPLTTKTSILLSTNQGLEHDWMIGLAKHMICSATLYTFINITRWWCQRLFFITFTAKLGEDEPTNLW